MIARLRVDAARIPLRDGSVHAVVTSPPYFGLRKYAGVPETTWPDGWRGTLGNEPAVDQYVAHIVACLREVRRVLRPDGVCWVVLGDSYSAFARGSRSEPSNLLLVPWRAALALQSDGWIVRNDVVWSKSAPMPESISGTYWQPHRVKVSSGSVARDGENGSGQRPHGATISEPSRAMTWPDRTQQEHAHGAAHSEFRARAEWRDCSGCGICTPNGGYVLRRKSWRHTRAHEVVVMLAKSMGYYCDAEAAAEPASDRQPTFGGQTGGGKDYGVTGVNRSRSARRTLENFAASGGATRNPRSVLHLGPEPLALAHFAAFPTALVAPFIRVSTSARGVCAACRAPWARVVERQPMQLRRSDWREELAVDSPGVARTRTAPSGTMLAPASSRTHGWRATCACDAGDPVPATILDPFAGSGTVGRVAYDLGRDVVLCDLSRTYLADIGPDRIGRAAASGQRSILGAAEQAEMS